MPQSVSSVPDWQVPVVMSQHPVSHDEVHNPPLPELDPEPLASSPESSPVASSPALPEAESPLLAPDGPEPPAPLELPELAPEAPDADPVVALPLPPSRSVVVISDGKVPSLVVPSAQAARARSATPIRR